MFQTVMLSIQNCKYKITTHLYDLIPPFHITSQNEGCTIKPVGDGILQVVVLKHTFIKWLLDKCGRSGQVFVFSFEIECLIVNKSSCEEKFTVLHVLVSFLKFEMFLVTFDFERNIVSIKCGWLFLCKTSTFRIPSTLRKRRYQYPFIP